MSMNWKLLDFDVGANGAYIPKQKNSVIGAAALGAGISALGGLIGSSLQNSANASMDAATREWQEKMYDKNNAYNTPVNQRKRLEAAGINPALAFASGNTGVASSAPNAVNHTPADYSALGAGFSSAGQMVLQSQQANAQSELLKEQAAAQRIENQYKALQSIATINEKLENAKKQGSETKWLEWQRDRSMALYDYERKNMYNNILEVQARTRLENANAYISEIDSRLRDLQNRANLRFTNAQIAHVREDINRIVAEEGVLTEKKLYQILENASMLPDVKKALRISDRMDSNPTETQILDALGLWTEPVTNAINTGVNVSNARSYSRSSKPRAQVKREHTYDGYGNMVTKEYIYDK